MNLDQVLDLIEKRIVSSPNESGTELIRFLNNYSNSVQSLGWIEVREALRYLGFIVVEVQFGSFGVVLRISETPINLVFEEQRQLISRYSLSLNDEAASKLASFFAKGNVLSLQTIFVSEEMMWKFEK